jgi:tetratricopeptide (TPR) repeat protein
MKSERRHELQENELSDWLEKSIEAVTPHLKTISAVVLGLAVCFGAYAIWKNRAAAEDRASWDNFYAASADKDPAAAMLTLADAKPSAPAGLWARLYIADNALAEGVHNLFINRAVAKPKLREAVDAYGKVAEHAAGQYEPMVARALYGQAKAYEALGEKSDLDEALKLYKRIAEDFPGGALAIDSNARIAALEKVSSKEFYDWFAKAQPYNPNPSEGGIPGIGPSFNDSSIPSPATETTVDPGFDPFKTPSAATDSTPPADSGTSPQTTPPSE